MYPANPREAISKAQSEGLFERKLGKMKPLKRLISNSPVFTVKFADSHPNIFACGNEHGDMVVADVLD